MRELSFVGVALDDGALVLESDGERFRLPVDPDLRGAVTGRGRQLAIPVEGPLSPRQIQDRLRHGASSEELADAAGMDVAAVARYEAPILAERAHQARTARSAEVDGRPLGEIVAEHLEAAGLDAADAVWDSWRREDGHWLVQVSWQETERRRSARWSFAPATRRLVAVDPQAQAMLRTAADTDDLTAVLRPVRPSFFAAPEPEEDSAPAPVAELPWGDGEDGEEAETAEPPSLPDEEAEGAPAAASAARPRPARRPRRASVPSWEEITMGRRSGPPGAS